MIQSSLAVRARMHAAHHPAPATRAVQSIPALLVAILFLALVMHNPNIIAVGNLEAIVVAAVPSALLAIGMSVIIIASGDDVIHGGIDLSLPNQSVLSAAIVALSLAGGAPLWLSLLVGVAAAIVFGIVNSLLVVWLRMVPILATLASSVLIDGITRTATTNRRIEVHDAAVLALRDDAVVGVPIIIVLTSAVLVVVHCATNHTRFGLHLQAVGGNREFARQSGIRPGLCIAASMLAASLLAGLSSVTLLSRASGWSTGSEDQLLLDMLLAAYLAPIFSRRSMYTPVGACIGAILVAALSNALVLGGVDNSLIDGSKGLLILVVVGSTALSKRSAS
ncbi:MAG: ABC transporter permease [Bifidobacterium sp.]|uniref:ABC transporter permease n=1 Tax=Bifidobacterium sp. TaxID=41200 RepID=UPI0039EBEF08